MTSVITLPKRVTYDNVNSTFHSLTEFTAGNGTLVGVNRAVFGMGAMPRKYARLYVHHVVSQSFTVLYTVVSRGNVIGWAYTAMGSADTARFIVVGTHDAKKVISA